MKKLLPRHVGLILAGLVLCATPAIYAQMGGRPSTTLTQPRLSPHDTINGRIGGNMVMLVYGRPHTKDPRSGEVRKIWGGLVPYGQVWRLGSDEATLMISQKPLVFGDLEVPAGAHTLFMLPSEDGPSKLIINNQIGQWGIPYTADSQKQELGRVDLTKSDLAEPVDMLTLSIAPVDGGGELRIAWEKTQYAVPFKVKG